MNTIAWRYVVVTASLLAALAASAALKPRENISNNSGIELDKMIPLAFGEWRGAEAAMPLVMPPDIKASLERLYSQTLARTYVNAAGERIMLSVAYGGDQSDALQAHRPEICYYAQGFRVSAATSSSLSLSTVQLPVSQLVAVQGARVEPITYWITVGDTAVSGKIQQKLAQLRYGLTGRIPDGILVRVSNLSGDNQLAYRRHADFIDAMLSGMTQESRRRLIGVRQL